LAGGDGFQIGAAKPEATGQRRLENLLCFRWTSSVALQKQNFVQ
jgi:hypothetical protein